MTARHASIECTHPSQTSMSRSTTWNHAYSNQGQRQSSECRYMSRQAKGYQRTEETYGQEPGDPLLGGEVQGKGDVPTLFMLQSSVLMSALESIAPGLHMDSCTKE